MKKKHLFIAVLLTMAIFLSAFGIIHYRKNKTTLHGQNGFAVVELFTSEGCSSCPPADEAVAALLKNYAKDVYIVAFHVDYWNYLGWKDSFSEAAYSQRQKEYAAAFKLNSVYTPQVIVNGKKELVGSDKSLLKTIIDNAIETSVNQPVKITAVTNENKQVTVHYTIEGNSTSLLNIALVQLNAVSEVKRGENKGRELRHINVVRDYKTVSLNGQQEGEVQLVIPPGFTKNELSVIAYLQNATDKRITGAGDTALK